MEHFYCHCFSFVHLLIKFINYVLVDDLSWNGLLCTSINTNCICWQVHPLYGSTLDTDTHTDRRLTPPHFTFLLIWWLITIIISLSYNFHSKLHTFIIIFCCFKHRTLQPLFKLQMKLLFLTRFIQSHTKHYRRLCSVALYTKQVYTKCVYSLQLQRLPTKATLFYT